jgi:hypothetical protein
MHTLKTASQLKLDMDYISEKVLLVLLVTGAVFESMIYDIISDAFVYENAMLELGSATRGAVTPPLCRNTRNYPHYVTYVRRSMQLFLFGITDSSAIFATKGDMELGRMHVPEGTEMASNPWLIKFVMVDKVLPGSYRIVGDVGF